MAFWGQRWVYNYALYLSGFNRLKAEIQNPFGRQISPPISLSLLFFLFSLPSAFSLIDYEPGSMKPWMMGHFATGSKALGQGDTEWKNEETERHEKPWFDLSLNFFLCEIIPFLITEARVRGVSVIWTRKHITYFLYLNGLCLIIKLNKSFFP